MEKSKRFERGMEVIRKYEDKSENPAYSITFDELMDLDPELENYIVEFAFGDIYSRGGLSHEYRTLITISSLVTQGLEPQLRLHINTGLTIGLTPNDIVDAIIHLLPYTGFPRVLNALKIAKEVFKQRGMEVKNNWLAVLQYTNAGLLLGASVFKKLHFSSFLPSL